MQMYSDRKQICSYLRWGEMKGKLEGIKKGQEKNRSDECFYDCDGSFTEIHTC